MSNQKSLSSILDKELTYDYYLALAYMWDTQDVTVPWDWREAHMEEIAKNQKKKTKQKQS